MSLLIIFGVFAVPFVNAESCQLPNGDNGVCKLFQDCEILKRVLYKTGRRPEDEQFLRQTRCGFQDGLPKVCCPNVKNLSCRTPEGDTGQCISLESCPHLLELLKDVNNTENIQFVRNSVCPGPEEHSICCGPPPDSDSDPLHVIDCEKTIGVAPPDPEGDCCGIDSYVGNKIIGGNATHINQYPWLVVIEYVKAKEKNKLLCGGSLISGKYVLTAAHCVTGPILRNGVPKFVRLGEYNVTNSGKDCVPSEIGDDDCTDGMILAAIDKTIPHPEYDPYDLDKKHDVALIKLQDMAPFTGFIRPICLPSKDYVATPPKNFSFYVAGWGRYVREKSVTRNSDVKLHVKLPYVLRNECQASIRTLPGAESIVFRSGQICAGGVSGQDSCRGDSGGPLMYENKVTRKFELVGLVGAGAELCGQEGIPGLYTYVYQYLSWIKNTIET